MSSCSSFGQFVRNNYRVRVWLLAYKHTEAFDKLKKLKAAGIKQRIKNAYRPVTNLVLFSLGSLISGPLFQKIVHSYSLSKIVMPKISKAARKF